MDIFKQASKQRLRFITNRGALSAELLWDLTLKELDDLAVSLEEEYKTSGKKSFLVAKSEKDRTAKLRFDIVLDVLNTKAEEEQAAQQSKENKEHNQKILTLIQDKHDETLKGKSVKELQKMLR